MTDKKQIIEKSAQLFKTYGIRSNTMDDIAREVGISKKTLYQQVSDKEALICLVIETERQRIEGLIHQVTADSANDIESLIRINVLIIRFLQEINPAAVNDLRKQFKSIYEDSKKQYQELFYRVIKQNLVSGKAHGIYRSDINEDFITQLHTDRIDKMQESDGLWGPNATSPDIIKEMTNYYIRGLITEKGELILNKHIVEFNKYLNE